MGIAASEARYLSLLARQSGCEFQGQQLQQSILDLSNKSSMLFSQQLDLAVPVMPMKTNYTTTVYTYESDDESKTKYTIGEWSPITPPQDDNNYTIIVTYVNDSGDVEEYYNGPAKVVVDTDGRFKSVTFTKPEEEAETHTLKVEQISDEEGYEDAMQRYKYEQALYDKAYADINAQISIINSQDKVLELKLSQLDIERTALKTEVESLQKVIKENVEKSFKTFNN